MRASSVTVTDAMRGMDDAMQKSENIAQVNTMAANAWNNTADGTASFGTADAAAVSWSLATSRLEKDVEYLSAMYQKADSRFYLTPHTALGKDDPDRWKKTPDYSKILSLFKSEIGSNSLTGWIHNHPWTGRATDFKFSDNGPGIIQDPNYDRPYMSRDANDNYSFYLYAPEGNLGVSRGKAPNAIQYNRSTRDELVAYDLPWYPDAIKNKQKLGPYNASWKWTK